MSAVQHAVPDAPRLAAPLGRLTAPVLGELASWPAPPEPSRAEEYEAAARRSDIPESVRTDASTTAPSVRRGAGHGVPELNAGEFVLAVFAGIGAIATGAIGFAASYQSVSDAAAAWGFAHPWMLPIGIDVAVPVFSVAYLLLVRLGMPAAWVRWVPWALTLATVVLNVAAARSLPARLAHGMMPLLWVALSEVAAHIYRVRIGRRTGTRMDRVRLSRWLMAPVATTRLRRRMVLWETTSYREALAREQDRLLARAALHRRYGRGWRRAAPMEDRMRLRMGTLTADSLYREPVREDLPAAGSASRGRDASRTPSRKRDTPRRGAGQRAARERDVPSRSKRDPQAAASRTAAMRAHWDRKRKLGEIPTGAELDRVAHTTDLGRRMARQWLAAEKAAPAAADDAQ